MPHNVILVPHERERERGLCVTLGKENTDPLKLGVEGERVEIDSGLWGEGKPGSVDDG